MAARPATTPTTRVAARNAQTGDPRTDPDVGGFVDGYFTSRADVAGGTWQTWHQQRIDGALGADEQQAAAAKATAHADTPSTAHHDRAGPPVPLDCPRIERSVRATRSTARKSHVRTRVELDIEGNQRAVRDAITRARTQQGDDTTDELGRIVMRYAYDMLGTPHPPDQHGSRRTLDAQRRRRQPHPRLGQPRPHIHERLRRAAPSRRADAFAARSAGFRSSHAES